MGEVLKYRFQYRASKLLLKTALVRTLRGILFFTKKYLTSVVSDHQHERPATVQQLE